MFDRQMKILVVASEAVPFAKTGGLADVAGSLPKALSTVGAEDVGNDVRIVIPRYKQIEEGNYVTDFPVKMGRRFETAIIKETSIEAQFKGIHKKVPVYLVDNYHYFHRDRLYMFDDEAERFIFFCKAVLDMLKPLNWHPDIIHCNDWQTGPIPFLLKNKYNKSKFYGNISSVYTIHNLQYQGNFPKEALKLLGVGEEFFRPDLLEFYGDISFMKAGILYADVINTVSRTYAQEIQTPEFGENMDGLLRKRSHDLYGILNGINYHEFDPRHDPRIYVNYDNHHIENKRENKYSLQREMGLPEKDVPLLGLISRLADQKGLDLFSEIIDDLMKGDLQLVILGSGEKQYEQLVEDMRVRFPDKIGAYIGFNSILAQRIYAGCDIFLMPSRFEPCGLGQLISLRYGTIPVVRTTGGLADTVLDYDKNKATGNGFSFHEYSSANFYDSIMRALNLYINSRDQWNFLVKRAMEQDFSWARSAVEYLQLYQTAIQKNREKQITA